MVFYSRVTALHACLFYLSVHNDDARRLLLRLVNTGHTYVCISIGALAYGIVVVKCICFAVCNYTLIIDHCSTLSLYIVRIVVIELIGVCERFVTLRDFVFEGMAPDSRKYTHICK